MIKNHYNIIKYIDKFWQQNSKFLTDVIKMHYRLLIKYWNKKELQGLKLKRAVEIIKQLELWEEKWK